MEGKKDKLERIKSIIRDDLPHSKSSMNFNFLNEELRRKYNIDDTDNVSSNDYDPIALSIIEEHSEGLILDCGSGKRSKYYTNVVNFEIVPYDTTDVLGVGEELPFQDNVFDAVFSLAVLEHVKDPFRCALEISRVMKPGATLYCVVPFLQPLHGYPNHYYNMSMKGLENLFDDFLLIEKQEIIASGLPIWTLSWFLNSWLGGLKNDAKNEFLSMTVADLIGNPIDYLERRFVKELSTEKNAELACTTALIAKKPPIQNFPYNQSNNNSHSDQKENISLSARLFSAIAVCKGEQQMLFDPTKVVQLEAGFVDHVEPVKAASNATIKTRGWAADLNAGKPANVVVVSDGKQLSVTPNISGSRPDVAKSLNNSNLEKTGWDACVPTSTLGRGKHKLEFYAGLSDNTFAPLHCGSQKFCDVEVIE